MSNPLLGMISMAVSLVALIVSGVCSYIVPQYPLIWQISLGIAAIGIVCYVVFDLKSLGEMFSRKTTRFGMLAMVGAFVGVAITIFSNLIVANHDWRKDFTANQIHSLSDQTKKVIVGLQNQIVVKVFSPSDQKNGFEDFFTRYTYGSKQLKIEFVDMFREPQLVREYKIIGEGSTFSTIILESEGRNARVESIAGPNDPRLEEKLTNGIIKVLKGGQRKVYFLAGHVEKSIAKNTPDGLARLKTVMEGSRFSTAELSLTKESGIPNDAEIIVIAGPKGQFFPEEIKQLNIFLEKGGSLLVMVDPESSVDMKEFLAKYGAEWKPKEGVFEEHPNKSIGSPAIPIVDVYDTGHAITKNFYSASFFQLAASIEKSKNSPAEETVTSLFSTSPFSFAQELKPGARIGRAFADRKGPLSLALAIAGKPKEISAPATADVAGQKKEEKKTENIAKTKGFRMVVVGDSDFVTNDALARGVNSDLFLNMMSWLADEEDLISIRPKSNDVRDLDVTEGRFRLAALITFIFLPSSAITTAFVVRRNRRRR